MNETTLIYPGDDNRVVVVVPSDAALRAYSRDALAQRLVPAGRPWRWVSRDQLPQSRIFRDAWEFSHD